jgi:hypothetical protein
LTKNVKTYLLLALVLIIWGTVVYQLFGGNDSPAPELDINDNVQFKPKQVKERESFTIVANYRDPFLGTIKKEVKKVKRARPVLPIEPEVSINYTGVINDKSTGKKIFFVTINGQQYLMEPKQKIQEVQLVKGNATSIEVLVNGKRKKIALQ